MPKASCTACDWHAQAKTVKTARALLEDHYLRHHNEPRF